MYSVGTQNMVISFWVTFDPYPLLLVIALSVSLLTMAILLVQQSEKVFMMVDDDDDLILSVHALLVNSAEAHL